MIRGELGSQQVITRRRRSVPRQVGFTLLELLAVVTLMALVAGISVAGMGSLLAEHHIQAVLADAVSLDAVARSRSSSTGLPQRLVLAGDGGTILSEELAWQDEVWTWETRRERYWPSNVRVVLLKRDWAQKDIVEYSIADEITIAAGISTDFAVAVFSEDRDRLGWVEVNGLTGDTVFGVVETTPSFALEDLAEPTVPPWRQGNEP